MVKGDLPRADWPLMVRFKDINDPNSVEQVNQVAIGVKRVWVETAGDPVSTGIEKRLGWLTRINGGYINGGFTSHDAPLGWMVQRLARKLANKCRSTQNGPLPMRGPQNDPDMLPYEMA
jgi:hypothetical protein